MLDDREVAAAAFLTGAFSHILADDASVTVDGFDLHGRDACALYLGGVFAELTPSSVDLESVNGEAGLAIRRAGTVVGVAVLQMSSGQINHVWLVTAPEKLRSWN